MKKHIARPLLVLALIALVWAPAGKSPTARAVSIPAPLVSSQLSSIAHRFAKANGDALPSVVQAVRTTRGRINDLTSPGAGVGDASHDVFAIVLHGHFTANLASKPPGAPTPTGKVMTIVVDATGGNLLDWGVGDNAPPIDTLGAVVNTG